VLHVAEPSSQEQDVAHLTARVAALEARNERVEADKRWETSRTRRVLIALLTYGAIAAYLGLIAHVDPWPIAVVPATAFLLSTLTVSLGRRFWERQTSDR
jgi:hypothetical protein